MQSTLSTPTQAQTALRHGAALQLRPAHGLLQLTDADRADFIHRMTTNNIAILKPGQVAVTVLTSPVARILYVFSVLQRGDTLWLLPAGEDGEALARHLRGQIFFMDKVKVENRSGHVRRLRLMGPQAGDVLTQADLPIPAAGHFIEAESVVVIHEPRLDLPGYELVVPGAESETFTERLVTAGALLLDDDDAYTARRVALGRPAVGYELTEAYNPLEAGLAWTCAENKGCYTGQEIIARQVTYGKVTKTLVGLEADHALSAGASVQIEGRAVGEITTVDPAGRRALAVLKRPANEAGTAVTVDGIPATVVELPFHE